MAGLLKTLEREYLKPVYKNKKKEENKRMTYNIEDEAYGRASLFELIRYHILNSRAFDAEELLNEAIQQAKADGGRESLESYGWKFDRDGSCIYSPMTTMHMRAKK